jgi:2-oxoglutarate ferredoxin oxidoreductase subunit alpha
VADSFAATVQAFNLAEEFQTPVVLLSDQEIAQRKETVDPIDTSSLAVVERRAPTPSELQDYARFRLTESGVSPISRPGLLGGNYLASGIEHNERGSPTASGEVHTRMNEKRIRKLLPLMGRRELFETRGDPAAPLALVAWGSVAGVAREAFAAARAEGVDVKLLVPRLLYPVAQEVYRDFFVTVQAGLVVEQSHQGQLHRLLRMFVDVPPGVVSLARSGANPFAPAEVVERLQALARELQRRRAPELQAQE